MKHLILFLGIALILGGVMAEPVLAQSASLSTPSWVQQTSGTSATLRGLRVVSSTVVWASGMGGVVLRTTDGGTTWQTKTAPDATYDNYEVEAIDSSTAWVFGTTGSLGAKIWKTTNGGSSWTEQYANANGYSDGILFYDANHGIAVSDPDPGIQGTMIVLTTTNGGTTWLQTPAANIPPVDSANFEVSVTNCLQFTGTTTWFVTYFGDAAFNPRVFKSTDKGLHWSVSPPVLIDDSQQLCMKNETTGIISNTNSCSVARTSTGWATSDSSLVLGGAYGLRAVQYVPGTNTLFIAGGPTATGIVARSDNGGYAWTQQPIPAVGRLRHMHFLNNSTGWIVGNSGAILKWVGGTITSVENTPAAAPSGFTLQANYPNPFNPSTTISYSVPKTSFVDLKVYDLLGHVVATLESKEQNAGTYTVRFDGSQLSSGVYYCTMRADGFVSTRPMMLLK